MNPARNGKTVRRPKAVRQELNRERERLQSHSSHAALAESRRKHTKTPCKTPKYTIKHTKKPHKIHKNTIKHDKTHEKGHPPPPSPRLRLVQGTNATAFVALLLAGGEARGRSIPFTRRAIVRRNPHSSQLFSTRLNKVAF